MTTFSTATVAHAPATALLDVAISNLTHNGFVITDRRAESATLLGPGMNSTKENPITGVSEIKLSVSNDELVANAELGGVDKMHRFLTIFPLSLGLVLGTIFAVVGGFVFGAKFGIGFGVPWARGILWTGFAMTIALLPVAPWTIIAPIMAKAIRKRTERAVEGLVRNADFIASNPNS